MLLSSKVQGYVLVKAKDVSDVEDGQFFFYKFIWNDPSQTDEFIRKYYISVGPVTVHPWFIRSS